MWTETTEGREYIKAISKNMVSEFAPEEMELFDELIAEYFADPTPPGLTESDTDDELAFGIGEVMTAVTPAATAMATAVLTLILTQFTEALETESAEIIKTRIKDILNSKVAEEEVTAKPEALTQEQLMMIRELARKQAKKFGMKSRQANKMEEALIGSIVLVE
jgi:hypothetical protein